jgi:hypothetical protein
MQAPSEAKLFVGGARDVLQHARSPARHRRALTAPRRAARARLGPRRSAADRRATAQDSGGRHQTGACILSMRIVATRQPLASYLRGVASLTARARDQICIRASRGLRASAQQRLRSPPPSLRASAACFAHRSLRRTARSRKSSSCAAAADLECMRDGQSVAPAAHARRARSPRAIAAAATRRRSRRRV